MELEKLIQEEEDKELDLALSNLTVKDDDPSENVDKSDPEKKLEPPPIAEATTM